MKKISDIHKYSWIELCIWFLILCTVAVGVRFYRYKQIKKLITYQIFMPDVDGLIVGSPVKFMGVQVGYIEKIKILSNDVYLKIVMTDKDTELPKGSIATVEFNGMGGSKSLEVYPPNEQSMASGKLIAVQNPKRLNDSLGLLNEMFDKIGSITSRVSFFAKETGAVNVNDGVDINQINSNMNLLDKWILKRGVKNGQSKSNK